MTFSVGHVQGGTGAGRKRPLLERQCVPWACECSVITGTGTRRDPSGTLPEHVTFHQAKLNPGYLVRCIDCGARRDHEA